MEVELDWEQRRLIEELERVEEEEEEQDLVDQAFREYQDELLKSNDNWGKTYCDNILSSSAYLRFNTGDKIQTRKLGIGLGLEICDGEYRNSNSSVWQNRGKLYSQVSWLHADFASHNFSPRESQFTASFVQNEAQTFYNANDGSLFQWTPEQELKEDKLSWMIDFRTLFSNSFSGPAPASTSTKDLDESSEAPAPQLVTSKELFSNLVLKTDFKRRKKLDGSSSSSTRKWNNFYSSATKTLISTEPMKNEKDKAFTEINCDEVDAQPVINVKEQYDFGPIPLDSSVWEEEEEELDQYPQETSTEKTHFGGICGQTEEKALPSSSKSTTAQTQVEKSTLRQFCPRQEESSKHSKENTCHLQSSKTSSKLSGKDDQNESTLIKINQSSEQLQPSEKLKLTKENEQLYLFQDVSESILSGLPVPVDKHRQNFKFVESAVLNLRFDPEEIDKIKTFPCPLFSSDAMTPEMEEPKSELALLLKDSELALAFKSYNKSIRIHSRALQLPNLTIPEKSNLRLKRSQATINLLNCNLTTDFEVSVKGHLQKALEDAEKVTLDQPDSWFGFFQLGQIHLFQNQFESAKLAFENALKVFKAYDKEKQGYLECLWRLLMTHQYCELESRFKFSCSEISKNEIAQLLRRHPVKITVNGEMEISSKSMHGILKRMKTHKNKRVVALECVYRANSLKLELESNSNSNASREKEMAQLYSKGATRKNPEALYNFAMLHFEGRGVSKDEEKATKLLKELALFSVDKDVEEEKCQFKDVEGLVQFPEPRKIFVAAAMYELGRRSKSEDEKESWFTKAKENGSALAANDLAILIKSRNRAHKKIDGIIQLFRTAAEQGINLAMRNLAWAYLQRYCAFDDTSDVKNAEYWFQKSLEERYQNPHPNPDPEFLRENQDFATCVEKLKGAAQKWQEKYEKFQTKSKSSSDSYSKSRPSNCVENPRNPQPRQISFVHNYFLRQKEIEAEAERGVQTSQILAGIMRHFISSLNSLEKYMQLKLQQTENDENSPLFKGLKMEILYAFSQSILFGAQFFFLTQEDKENLQTIANEMINHVDLFSPSENLVVVSVAEIVLEFVQNGSLEGILKQVESIQTEVKTETAKTQRKEEPPICLWFPLARDSRYFSLWATEKRLRCRKPGCKILVERRRRRRQKPKFSLTFALFSILFIIFTNYCNCLILFSF